MFGMAEKIIQYRSLMREGTGRYEEKKSVFNGYAAHAFSEEEALAFIEHVKELNPGYSCICYGYICGYSGNIQRFEDGHEPQGGLQVLNALKAQGVTACVAAVARYWGGIKLGAGPLGRAFGKAAIAAVADAMPALYELTLEVEVRFDYTILGKLEYFIQNSVYKKIMVKYEGDVAMILKVRSIDMPRFTQEIGNISSGSAQIKTLSECFECWNTEI